MKLKIVVIVFLLMFTFGCERDKWTEVKRIKQTALFNGPFIVNSEKDVIVIIEKNQHGQKRAYALTIQGKKIDINVDHAESLFEGGD